MRKMCGMLVFCFLVAASFWGSMLLGDRQRLNEELIRLHVVANSDSDEDQAVKLQVRDAVMESLGAAMANVADVDQVKAYLRENIPKIRMVANEVLTQAGYDPDAVVTLCRETFDTRAYDTFTLPAGVYESLRIVIGEGEGKNWWCVVFPTLCIPAAGEGFEDVAAGAGFPDTLTNTLTGEEGYEIRFFLLDTLGRLENIFFSEE